MNKKKNGFTLVELLAVVAVLAILMIIAIPAVLKSVRGAQKESFFLYAQNLQSKAIAQYTQDLEQNKKNTDCAVYDIGKDLDLSDTGEYEGWVKVIRKPSKSGKRTVDVPISNSNGILYVKYCISDANCIPTESVMIAENTKETTVSKVLEKEDRLCVQYEYPDKSSNTIKKSSVECFGYEDGLETNDTYKYSVVMTIKDGRQAVENLTFNDKMSYDKFKDEIDEFKKTHSSSSNPLAIASPTCSKDDPITYKGTTTTTQVKVTKNTTTSSDQTSTVVATTTATTRKTDVKTTKETTTRETEVITTTKKTEKTTLTEDVTTSDTTTTQRSTIQVTKEATTSIDINDRSLLLKSLSVPGYDEYIHFSPYQFSYSINVPNSVTSISINATLEEPQTSSLAISGNEHLLVGNNPVVIAVHNNNTNKNAYYRVNVRRLDIRGQVVTEPVIVTTKPVDPNEEGLPDPKLDSSNASLQKINISGYTFDFDPNMYDYIITTEGEKSLFIDYVPQVKESIVSMSGNNDLEDGSIITISVRSQNGYYTKDYKLKIKFREKKSNATLIMRIAIVVLVLLLAVLIAFLSNKKKKKASVNQS